MNIIKQTWTVQWINYVDGELIQLKFTIKKTSSKIKKVCLHNIITKNVTNHVCRYVCNFNWEQYYKLCVFGLKFIIWILWVYSIYRQKNNQVVYLDRSNNGLNN